MKSKTDRIAYGIAGVFGFLSGIGFGIVTIAHRNDIGIFIAAGIAATALFVLGVAYVNWAVTK
jgi:hypothetical protein